MIDLLVIAGPFQRSTLGDRRTFSWPGIGDRRTFFSEWIAVLGFQKPTKPDRFRSYKAYVSSKLSCRSKDGSGLRPACLVRKSIRTQDGPQEWSGRTKQLKKEPSGELLPVAPSNFFDRWLAQANAGSELVPVDAALAVPVVTRPLLRPCSARGPTRAIRLRASHPACGTRSGR